MELVLRRNCGFSRANGIPDAHRDDGKRFVVQADEKLGAFMELESAIRASGERLAPAIG
jgi:hypothetical protein